ncbi:MAG: MBOAT family protein [Lachnospiraceae bacterium]|nr:MBOAT family protein [Lachnospiraceae bacterium]
MTINSMSFLIFFLGIAIVYYLPFLKKYQWAVLLAASYLFYFFTGTDNFIYILVTTVTTHVSARMLGKKNNQQAEWLKVQKGSRTKEETAQYKARIKSEKNRIVFFDIVVNIGLLIFVKYSNFFIFNINRILTVESSVELKALNILVPLGISYYTLQSIGYVLDVSKGKTQPEGNVFKTALFVSYFPQITQGPIGRFDKLAPQLFGAHGFSWQNLSSGCQRILWGFFKKTVIADRMNPFVDEIFLNFDQHSGFTLFLGCVYFSIQAYADFSAYMDIAAGYSQILGIGLEENFKRPFFSQSLAEYWRRWHITLSSWFRDYLFYPLSLSAPAVKLSRIGRKYLPARIAKLVPSVYAMFIVWFATGFWHDASWRYILWGIANGTIMISSMCLSEQFKTWKQKLHIREENKFWQLFRRLRTFLLISLLKVFPAASSTGNSLRILKRIVTDFRIEFSYQAWFPGLIKNYLAYILFGLVLFLMVSIRQEKEHFRVHMERKSFVYRWCLYLVLLCAILSFGMFGTELSGGFEYAQY